MKTQYINDWETWKELCEQNNIDPYRTVEFGIDMGDGNSRNYEFGGDVPKKEDE